MKAINFNRLLKEYKNDLQKIIWLHCDDKIFLSEKQIQKVIDLRGERIYARTSK